MMSWLDTRGDNQFRNGGSDSKEGRVTWYHHIHNVGREGSHLKLAELKGQALSPVSSDPTRSVPLHGLFVLRGQQRGFQNMRKTRPSIQVGKFGAQMAEADFTSLGPTC